MDRKEITNLILACQNMAHQGFSRGHIFYDLIMRYGCNVDDADIIINHVRFI